MGGKGGVPVCGGGMCMCVKNRRRGCEVAQGCGEGEGMLGRGGDVR